MIDVEVLQVVVEVDRPCTKVAAKQSRVCSENSGDIQMPLPTQWDSEACLPLVEVCNHRAVQLARHKLAMIPFTSDANT
jgi:hypothetical protein